MLGMELIVDDYSIHGLILNGSLCFIEHRNDTGLEYYMLAVSFV